MGDIKKSSDKLTVFIDDKYLKNVFPNRIAIHCDWDELFVAAMKYLKDKGILCEFLGFNEQGHHVVVIDGIKYYRSTGRCDITSLNYLTFVIVNDSEHDFVVNFYTNRVTEILDVLEKY
ncbi:MAG: hypothetical protein K0R34_3723 [Herbinix sp.]|jgi:hypothetical protein|nr:hypothetical protein [Herbinix sp.]